MVADADDAVVEVAGELAPFGRVDADGEEAAGIDNASNVRVMGDGCRRDERELGGGWVWGA